METELSFDSGLFQLLQKHLNGQVLTAGEQVILDSWLQDSEDKSASLKQLQSPEWVAATLRHWEKPNAEALWIKSLQGKQKAAGHIPLLRRRLIIAAAAVFILMLAAYWLFILHHPSNLMYQASTKIDIQPGSNKATLTIGNNAPIELANDKTGINAGDTITYNDGQIIAAAGSQLQLTTPNGGQYQLLLPDGSKVWLNAASSVSFPSAFTGNSRTISVAGEVYIEVAPHKNLPFYVNTPRSQIQVLGTSININSYINESEENTTLIEGKIKINRTGEASVILDPGQQAGIMHSGQRRATTVSDHVNISKVLAWKNGIFNFNGVTLEQAMKQLERWYNLKVVYEKGIPDIRFVGKISRAVPLTELLKGLEGAGVHFRIENNHRLVVLP